MSHSIVKESQAYFRKVYEHLRPYRRLLTLVVILSFAASFLEGFSIGAFIPVLQLLQTGSTQIDQLVPQLRNVSLSLTTIMVILFGLIVVRSFVQYWNIILINMITTKIRRDLQVKLFAHLTKASLSFFHTAKIGHMTSTIQNYTEQIASSIFATLNLSLVLAQIVIYLALLFIISWKATGIVLSLAVIALPLIYWLLTKLRHLGTLTVTYAADLQTRILDMLGGISLMKIVSTENYERNRFNETAEKLAATYIGAARYLNILTPWSEVAISLLLLSAVFASTRLMPGGLTFSFSLLLTYVYVFFRFYSKGSQLLYGVSKIIHNTAPFHAYEELLKNAEKSILKTGTKVISNHVKGISFEKVQFGYNPQQLILKDLSFFIPWKTTTALVGPTGSGKSTIAHLLAGLYFPNSGTIKVDDTSIDQLDGEAWRKKIGYIAQDSIFFNDTIKFNIAYGTPEADDQKIKEACQIAQIDDFIEKLPQKYDTIIGERGTRLSGGQRQRLNIARAILRQPDIIIMDEATSSLDAETEKKLQTALQAFLSERTVVIIAHRLATIKHADKIIVLHNGAVLDQGKHEELRVRNELYKYLCLLQFQN